VLDGVGRAVVRVLPVDDRRDLPGLGILGDVRVRVRGDDQDACDVLAVVADLMSALRPARERDHVALGEHTLRVAHPDGRRPAQHHEKLFGAAVE
jgi:hypothetical protein